MVAIVARGKLLKHLLMSIAFRFSHYVDISPKLRGEFFLGYAANVSIFLVHAYIIDIVQLAEDAQLGELGDSREEHEAQILVATLQRRIEIAHHIAEHRQIFLLVHYIEKRSIVLVNEHNHLLARLLIGSND